MKRFRKPKMASILLTTILALAFVLQPNVIPSATAASAYVRVNQVGYPTDSDKRAYLMTDTVTSGNFQVKKASDNTTVHTASIGSDQGSWSSTYSKVYALNFNGFKTPGTYYIEAGGARSPDFKIDSLANLYGTMLENVEFYFQAQRDGPNVISSVLNRQPSHLNDQTAAVYQPPVYGGPDGDVLQSDLVTVTGSTRDVSGGWFDAGDYVKFVHNTSYAADLMLISVRDRPDLVGSGKPADFYAEAKFGLEWLLKMWDDSTKTFYYQVGIGSGNSSIMADHDIWRLPEDDDNYQSGDNAYRYIRNRPAFRAYPPDSQISPNLAGRLSAAFALCYQVYKDSDKPFADNCLKSAQHIFDKAKTTSPGELLTASPHAYYPETEWRDDMELGAAELYFAVASGDLPSGLPHTDPLFYLQKAAHWADAYINTGGSDTLNLYDVSAIGHYELYKGIADEGKPSGLEVTKAELVADLKRQLDIGVTQANSDPFGFGFGWAQFDTASHGLGLAITARMYEEITGKGDYAGFAQRQVDDVLGANAWGTTFIIGAGTTFPNCPQNQIANLNGSLTGGTPILKGAVVNGPNGQTASGSMTNMKACPPGGGDVFSQFTGSNGAVYKDNVESWPTVENAIDFTGTSVLALVLEHGPKGTIVDLLGDKDDFIRGDPIDNPQLSIETQKVISATAENNWAALLDEPWGDRPVGATHYFYVPQNTPINAATLTLRFRGCQWVKNDLIIYQPENFQGSNPTYPLNLIVLTDTLGFEPVPGGDPSIPNPSGDPDKWPNKPGPTYIMTVDLANVPVRILSTKEDWGVPGESWPSRSQVPANKKDVVNLLPRLTDGQFDLVFLDDTQIDYSELRIEYGVRTETPIGDRVTVAPAQAVYVTLDQVVGAGDTTANSSSGSSATVPPNYQIVGSTFDIETTASYLGPNTVMLHYDEAQFPDEDRVRLLHDEGGQYVDRTLYVDRENNWVAGQADAFSEFAVAKFTGALLKEFTVYAEDSVYLGPGGVQNLGSVGSNGSITLNSRQTLAGDLRALGPVSVGPGTTVNGDVISGEGATIYGQVNGSVVQYADLAPIEIPTSFYDFVDGPDKNIATTTVVTPGTFGDVTVAPGVTLHLESGVYYMRAFDLANGSSLEFDTLKGPVILRIGKPTGAPDPALGPLTVGEDVTMNVISGTSQVFYEVLRDGDVEIGDRSEFLGKLFAAQNPVVFGESCTLIGAAYAKSVTMATPYWQPYTYYAAGDRVIYGGKVYECRQSHTSLPYWRPPYVPALWQRPAPDGVSEWTSNTYYPTGSLVTYNGITYECLQGHTSLPGWEPPNVPALWDRQ